MARNTLARIDTGALRHNLARVRSLAPDSRVMAVVKADAYGHRLDLCLPALRSADLLAVATLEEARAIRRLGSHLPVLLLEGVIHADDLPVAAELALELTVHHPSQVEALERFGRSPSPRLWLKIDSGMNRLGVPGAQAGSLQRRLLELRGVEQVNLMTHFANADHPDVAHTRRQIERFEESVRELPGERCLANSAAIVEHAATHADWVRAGILLYGISPFAGRTGADLGLRAVMTLSAELMAINQVAAGETIGYGARFQAKHPMLIGVACIGYGDGYPRSLVDGTPVLVNGRRCRLVGRVSMDMITIDLTDANEARIGDEVLLWGPELPIETIAEAAATIPYELVCRITRRVRYRSYSETVERAPGG